VNYTEYESIVEEYNALVARAQSIYDKLPASKKDAFYELALFPAKASAQVNEMYLAAAKNALYAQQGRASTNDMAERTRELFQADVDLMTHFQQNPCRRGNGTISWISRTSVIRAGPIRQRTT
jgi:hypothetical protein